MQTLPAGSYPLPTHRCWGESSLTWFSWTSTSYDMKYCGFTNWTNFGGGQFQSSCTTPCTCSFQGCSHNRRQAKSSIGKGRSVCAETWAVCCQGRKSTHRHSERLGPGTAKGPQSQLGLLRYFCAQNVSPGDMG